jgi:hypothetical protein
MSHLGWLMPKPGFCNMLEPTMKDYERMRRKIRARCRQCDSVRMISSTLRYSNASVLLVSPDPEVADEMLRKIEKELYENNDED